MRILVVDDYAGRHHDFVSNNADCTIVSAYTSHEGITLFDAGEYDYISLDHDLGYDSDIIPMVKHMGQAFINGKKKPTAVFMHSMNPVGAANAASHIRRLVPCYPAQRAWLSKDFFRNIVLPATEQQT